MAGPFGPPALLVHPEESDMDAGAVALLIPVAAIVMGGLVKLARDLARGHRNPDMSAWDARMEALETRTCVGSKRSERDAQSGWISPNVFWLRRERASTSGPQSEDSWVGSAARRCLTHAGASTIARG